MPQQDTANAETFYLFTDDQGVQHIVNKPEALPADPAKPVSVRTLKRPAVTAEKTSTALDTTSLAEHPGAPSLVEATSVPVLDGTNVAFIITGTVALLAAAVMFRKQMALFTARAMWVAIIASLMAAGVLAWSLSGSPGEKGARRSPSTLVERANDASRDMQRKSRQKEETLDALK